MRTDALASAVLAGEPPAFDPHTGKPTALLHAPGAVPGTIPAKPSPGARAGYEPPRYCQICGRRMVVQVFPQGWEARCSRHGELDSAWLER
ncbi:MULTISPECIES: hypothetical protein [unclassified Corynebacterium]|uniref:biotin synthase auxiliary protein BsaP n=1 Tax=unclassified Corynebacterium TaxID=2624378 RepID=UPI0029CA5C0F|nr:MULTISPECIES: hypothetical protein [unclassified Corynebacterium]WPF65909.1 hypothetical protein OLX12_10190 [Corynebacterium sp. 22KM0430]WPF68402.1 hypothetical protein OLW90_10185 [Corynebacterium sp. 21KM1197]